MPSPQDHDPATDATIAEPLRPVTAPEWTPETISPAAPTTEAVTFATRKAGPSKLRAGAVAGAAVALAVGAVATSFAASPSPTTTSADSITTSRDAGGAVGVGAIAPALAAGPMPDGPDGVLDRRRMGDHGFRDITIASISGSSVALKTDDGWSRTITVTDSVKLIKGGQAIALSDLSVGDDVRLIQTRKDDGTYTVDGLVVVVPSVHGTVSDVSSSAFKVTNRDGSVWTITVNGSTQYQYGTGDGSLSDVTNGETVVVLGDKTGDNALTALTVRVAPDKAMGTVKSKTTDTIVITKRDGSTVTVHVDGDTTYRVAGADSADLADITVDMNVGVAGRERADGSIDAAMVRAGDGRGVFRGDGGGGFGGDGRGDFGGDGRGDFGGGRGGHGGFGGFGLGMDGMGGPGQMDDLDDEAPSASPTS